MLRADEDKIKWLFENYSGYRKRKWCFTTAHRKANKWN